MYAQYGNQTRYRLLTLARWIVDPGSEGGTRDVRGEFYDIMEFK